MINQGKLQEVAVALNSVSNFPKHLSHNKLRRYKLDNSYLLNTNLFCQDMTYRSINFKLFL
jgi:hypothetical protein